MRMKANASEMMIVAIMLILALVAVIIIASRYLPVFLGGNVT
jgi:hypothetical protein